MTVIQFIYPIDGDVLTPAEGVLQGDLLWITVKLQAAGPVTVNNLPCIAYGTVEGAYRAISTLRQLVDQAEEDKMQRGDRVSEEEVDILKKDFLELWNRDNKP